MFVGLSDRIFFVCALKETSVNLNKLHTELCQIRPRRP